jgi:AcrR family transcriptional regulator
MPKRTDRATRIIDSALKLAAEQPWHALSLADIARAAGIPVLQVYAVFRSKAAILEAFHRRIDEQTIAGAGRDDDADAAERPRDRLFDTLMRRFDALGPYKAAIQHMARDAWSDPLAALCAAPSLRASMVWMLEASGVSASGWRGQLRANLLLGLYLSILRMWLIDESPDMIKTMAALDRRLRQNERWLGLAQRRSDDEAEAPSAA